MAVWTWVCAAAELEVTFPALERHLAEQMVTQDGRRFFAGKNEKQCTHAYLERPRFSANGGKLRIKARFSGRSALNMLGLCVGLGDAFDATIDAVPVYREGAIRLDQVAVDSGQHNGFYARRVRGEIQKTLARDFAYPVLAEARRVMAEQKGKVAFGLELPRFTIQRVDVRADGVVFELDFRLALK
jgi:hypothetical protein